MSSTNQQALNQLEAMVGWSGGKVSTKLKKLARARGLHIFNAGDTAVLLRRHKDRTFKALVTVVKASWSEPLTKNGNVSVRALRGITYTVKSELGGVMTVGASSLRPGGVLDRMALELQISDESEVPPDALPV